MDKIYDSAIIGAGPAGLSAAIYLARYNRKVIVFDTGQGRSTYPQHNQNYLGFPKGISALKLRQLGKKQAQNFKVQFIDQEVIEIKKATINNPFSLITEKNTYLAKTIVLATGVVDIFPIFEKHEQYIGKSLFWCLTCDGFKSINKKIIVVGNDDLAAINALQFLNFTQNITIVTNCDQQHTTISNKLRKICKNKKIPLQDASIVTVTGNKGLVNKILLSNEKELKAQIIFSHQGSNPNCKLAAQLTLKLTNNGYIHVDTEQRTSLKGVYAAGDITRIHSHQIVTAAHEGATAAQTINYDLYHPYQKL